MLFKRLFGFIMLLIPLIIHSQNQDSILQQGINPLEQRIEYYTEQADAEVDFSEWVDELEMLKIKPVNLNSTDQNELRRLLVLNELQIQNLLAYTREFGQLASIYELQVVDGFNEEVVQQLLPYITLTNFQSDRFSLKKAMRYGRPEIMTRYQRVLEQQQGFANVSDSIRALHPNDYYLGSADALYIRFLYNYRDRFQLGIVAEKDAGETFLPETDTLRKGFDFYSAHLYLKDAGKLKYLALGDYHVQFGQGLTLWTGLSFSKAPGSVTMRKRAAAVRPHQSSNEYAFMRGAAATYAFNRIEITGFYSNRKRDANLLEPDSLSNFEEFVSSLQETGYHRTPGELADRNAIREQLMGGHISYNGNRLRAGITAYHSEYDKEFKSQQNEYNKFQLSLTSNTYAGIDYSYSYKRLTLYGEGTKQFKGGLAFIQGLSFTPDPRLSLAMIYRNYPRNYLNKLSAAFGEGSNSTSEKGLYMGLVTTPVQNISISAFADFFSYPWLHYRVDAPSVGKEYSVQLSYSLRQRGEMLIRYRQTKNPLNVAREDSPSFQVSLTTRSYYQWQLRYQALPWLNLSNRVYYLHRTAPGSRGENGYFISQDFQVKPSEKQWTVSARYALFDADSYDSRIYAYENDVPNSFSVPSLSGKGSRIYVMVKIRLIGRCDLWLRYAQTWYSNIHQISTGPALIEGNRKSDVKVMLKIKF